MTGVEAAAAADLAKASQELQHLVQQRDDLVTSVNSKLERDPNGTYGFRMGSVSFLLPINSPRCRRVLAEILQGMAEQIEQAAKHVTAVMATFQEANSDKPSLPSARPSARPPARPLPAPPGAQPPMGWCDTPREEPMGFAPDPDEAPIQFVSEPL